MKKLVSILSILIIGVLFTRCQKEALDQKLADESGPQYTVSAVEFIKGAGVTEQDVKDFEKMVKDLASSGLCPALANIINDPNKKIAITLVKNESSVQIGEYATGKIDLEDLKKLPTSGPASQQAALAHEIQEQYQKQHKGQGPEQAHRAASLIEGAVGKYIRVQGSDRQGPFPTRQRGIFKSFRVTDLEGKNPRTVRITYSNGNNPQVTIIPETK